MTEPGPTARAVMQMVSPRTGPATVAGADDKQEKLCVSMDGAAEMMSVHRSTVKRLVDEGELPSVKIGKYRRIRVDAIKSYLRNQEFKQLNARRAAKENAGPLT